MTAAGLKKTFEGKFPAPFEVDRDLYALYAVLEEDYVKSFRPLSR